MTQQNRPNSIAMAETIRSLSNEDGDGNENAAKQQVYWAKTITLHERSTISYMFAVICKIKWNDKILVFLKKCAERVTAKFSFRFHTLTSNLVPGAFDSIFQGVKLIEMIAKELQKREVIFWNYEKGELNWLLPPPPPKKKKFPWKGTKQT